ncbi:peptidyl-prolyl cis-trans isomerase B (cyclophilin B) [Pseudomonas brassicacearum]|uniref:Peptidyl-prolyl cis-trans isomerase n=2 Tax=Pseudomonas brassicacearum TaxID=930166 RepID=A0AAW8M4U3_9PSED|nr:peptidyl-prolyl cis-trans isomerase B (cyclophilin B) [Pseudomonas brassicacearum]
MKNSLEIRAWRAKLPSLADCSQTGCGRSRPEAHEFLERVVIMTQVKLTTNHGDIVLELNAEKAPLTVANFLEYVKAGHYENTVFHRVIGNFMIQGGGFEPGMKEKKDKRPSIQNEADNGLPNEKYSVAMARTMEPHSASAQFFINVADNSFLNHSGKTTQGWGYAVFGKVVEGTDVVDKIKGVSTTSKAGHQDVPAEDVIIEKAEIIE